MTMLNDVLKELRFVTYEFSCMMQILNDLEKAYPMNEHLQTHSLVHLINSWLKKQDNFISDIADKIDDELILLHQENQKK